MKRVAAALLALQLLSGCGNGESLYDGGDDDDDVSYVDDPWYPESWPEEDAALDVP